MQELELFCDEHDAFFFEVTSNCLQEYTVGSRGVYARKWVVKKVDIGVLVNGTCQADAGFLAIGEFYTVFANYRQLIIAEQLEVVFKL